MTASINFEDLTAEQRKKLGVPTQRQSKFSQEEVRSWSLKILAAMASLSRAERDRVLRHAMKVNKL
jgi:hypothetical protein